MSLHYHVPQDFEIFSFFNNEELFLASLIGVERILGIRL